jgi:hypothetical protein
MPIATLGPKVATRVRFSHNLRQDLGSGDL